MTDPQRYGAAPPASAAPSGPPALRRSLGMLDSVAIAASSTAATTTIGIGLGVTAGVVGLHLPAIMLLAFLPILGIAGAFSRLNKVEPNAGNGYVWVGRSLSPWLGFMVGWVNIVAAVVFLAYTTAVTGSAVLQLAGDAGAHRVAGLTLDPGSTAQTTGVGIVVLLAVTLTAVSGIRSAARLQGGLLIFEYVVLLGFCGYGIVAGPHPFSLSWFDPFQIPSASALAQGMLLSVFCYWGFEAAFSVNEEVRDPRQASRAGITTLVTMLGLFLLGSIAFQRVLSESELAGHGAEGLAFFGNRLADQPLAALPLVALMFSAVASLQAGVIPTARAMFAMSRDRTLGPAWAKVSPRYGTPAAGTLMIGALAAAVAGLALVIPRLADMILAAVNAIGMVVALSYALTALAAAVRFRGLLRENWRDGIRAVVLPSLSAATLLGLGGYLGWSFYTSADHLELSPDNGWFLLLVPSLMVASGFVAAAWAKWGRRSPYFDTGRGTDADAPQLLAVQQQSVL
ncbi:APC family permease [Streptomyces turgidiscabies]|uniref:Amino acid permease n=1 Tax=Streptomyces turgidiscabies (strain Car8) TaxID=698760 RepID=L7F808_STRT8|nr:MULTISPECIES: APC family permease [Streptomyces]ELP66820.1 amino acid permease [Streptomyces turgidiscabies Car8]MDX3491810.1 APC family permease [Streptomyces turgidiscabies]GAQ72074.1 low-affinity putrescine importer PlaP [Streptomyces turgidiscabies]